MGTKNYPHALVLRLSDAQFTSLSEEARAKQISLTAVIRSRIGGGDIKSPSEQISVISPRSDINEPAPSSSKRSFDPILGF